MDQHILCRSATRARRTNVVYTLSSFDPSISRLIWHWPRECLARWGGQAAGNERRSCTYAVTSVRRHSAIPVILSSPHSSSVIRYHRSANPQPTNLEKNPAIKYFTPSRRLGHTLLFVSIRAKLSFLNLNLQAYAILHSHVTVNRYKFLKVFFGKKIEIPDSPRPPIIITYMHKRNLVM